jgi:toxin ParE1/3/4
MAQRVVWSPTALEDVEAIAAYISRDSISYAAAVVKRILDSTRSLQKFPHAGRAVPEFDDTSIREVYSFRVIYRVKGETVIIASVVHGKRLLDLVPDSRDQ